MTKRTGLFRIIVIGTLVLLGLSAATPILAAIPPLQAGRLFPYSDGNRYGYLDLSGEWAIDPLFEYAAEFSEGLAAVSVDGKTGYIDASGQMVIEPEFRFGRDFSDGLALVDLAPPDSGESRMGYIDDSGDVVIDASSFTGSSGFFEGLAGVYVDDKYGFINKTGQVVIEPQFDFASNFSEGLAAVVVKGKSGYINPQGKMVIQPDFDFGNDFSEGLAAVTIDNRIGYVDKSGDVVIEPKFVVGFQFSEGLAFVDTGDKTGYIDPDGEVVITGAFDFGYPFSQGLAAVEVDGQYGYVDNNGKIVIQPQFSSASPFQDDVAMVTWIDAWGCVDLAGNVLFRMPLSEEWAPQTTDVFSYLPGVPPTAREGTCEAPSLVTSINSAWRCQVNSQVFDPCLIADDGQTLVCGMDPNQDRPGFQLDTALPLPKRQAGTSATPAAVEGEISRQALENAEYQSDWAAGGVARLSDGVYSEKYQDSATGLVISLMEPGAFGDLNGDGQQDAAVLLAATGGGSGVFIDLAAVVDEDGVPRHVASVPLGDRVVLESMNIVDGQIVVDVITHRPSDAMCCPTLPLTLRFALEDDWLIQKGENAWLVRLADGATCTLLTEDTPKIEQQKVNYACDDGSNILGDLMPGIPWTAQKVTISESAGDAEIESSQITNLTTVWQPVDPVEVVRQIGLTPMDVTVATGDLAQQVSGHIRPAVPFNPDAPSSLNGEPAHLRFSFDDELLPAWSGVYPNQRQLLVLPIQEYRDIYQMIGTYELDDRLETLQAMLKDRPAVFEAEVPVLPDIPASQVFHTQVKYLDFQGGSGIRFISYYAQDVSPIINESIFYTFQGLTDDGQYYVALYYPVSTPSLPDTYEDAEIDDDYEAFEQQYGTYLQQTIKMLDGQSASQFAPDLEEIDSMVESLKIGP